jgi:hypothetical protein
MVFFDKDANRWEAMRAGKFLGSFGSEEEAAAAVVKDEQKPRPGYGRVGVGAGLS